MRVAFWTTIIYVVTLIGRGPEILVDLFGTSFYHITILDVLLVFMGLATGVLGKVSFSKITLGWVLFYAWITFTLPFSGYRGGSLMALVDACKSVPVLFFVAAFLSGSIESVRKGMWTMLWSGILILTIINVYSGVSDVDDRLASDTGTFANANEVAISMIVLIPFVSFIAANSRYNWIVRIGAVALICLAAVTTLKTGSRGGLLSLVILAVILFFRSGLVSKAMLLVVGLIGLLLAAQLLPQKTMVRLMTVFTSDNSANAESAIMSALERQALFWESVDATMKHPLFGVGLGVYAPMMAKEAEKDGKSARWRVTHNAFTEVSAEVGVPGLILWLVAMFSSWRSLSWVKRFTRGMPELKEVFQMAVVVQIALAMYLLNCLFCSMAYSPLMFTLCGFSLALFLLTTRIKENQMYGRRLVTVETQSPTRQPLYSRETFQTKGFGPSAIPVPVAAGDARPANAGDTADQPDPNRDAPWKRNPRRYPPPPGAPSR